VFSVIRRRVTYMNVAVTVALVFAMTGGAYAAKHYLITSTKQISPAVLKQLQGKRGAAGTQGSAGPAGAAGPQGPQGSPGAAGTKGENGASGASVTSTESKTKIGPCKEGGSEFHAASGITYACSGEKGKDGTFGGESLPKGKTLKGAWAGSGFGEAAPPAAGFGVVKAAVSFALPVTPTPTVAPNVIGLEEGAGEPNEKLPEGCTGNHIEPGAAEGHLCIFLDNAANLFEPTKHTQPSVSGSAETATGFTVTGFTAAKGSVIMEGTWAVTG
jgi:hypothetical protein